MTIPRKRVIRQSISGLLANFAQQAVLRAFVLLKMAADTDPFIFIHIIFLNHPVQHQIAVIFLDVAQSTQTCLHRTHLYPFL